MFKNILAGLPPMLLVTLRYTFAAVPAIFFFKRLYVGWEYIFAYGIAVGVGQFRFTFASYICISHTSLHC